jgi:ABC-type lipoprotein release transport system permease subunit
MFGGPHPIGTLKLRVVGLFNEKPADPFWHGESFQPVKEGQLNADNLLVPNASLLAALDSIAASSHQNVVFSPLTFNLTWYYHLDPSRITIDQLNSLTGQLLHLQAAITNIAGNTPGQSQSTTLLKYPYLLQVNLFSPTPGSFQIPTTLEQYSNRVAVVNIPSTMLSLQVVVLILFFVSLLTNVLIERQADAIALLHSRGASRGQIYSSMFIQSISLCIIALTTGPILALMVVSSISSRILAPGGQDAISIVTGHPVQAVLAIGWYALATVSIALLAIGLILRRAIHTDVFSLRRETTRTTQRPIWQRLHLDLVAAIIALSGYGVSVYLASIGSLLDTRTSVLISAPLSLLAAIFLLIGSLLLFLRFFPYLLRLGARIAGWNRGAAPMLALTHMARSPRQTLRMTMLLSLATAFAIFSLVFAASQAQRIHDIAAYESGADFSGDTLASTHPLSMKAETAKYAAIAGVLSATVGYTGEGFSAGISPNTPIEIRAVDASTFARTAIWTTQDSSQSLASLMTQLTTQRQFAISNNIVPVIADAATMQKLDLRIGSRFIVNVNTLTYGTLNCLVIAEVQHIPTVNNNDDSGTVADYTSPGGILLDYATYAAVYVRGIRANGINGASTLPINHVWLRTSASQPALAHIRTTLDTSGLRLDNLYDRRILIDILDTDPLYLGLIVILTLGTVTTLLLALVGDLLVSWLSVRRRLTSFAVLRALGAAPLQITSVLTWEQGFVYSTALFLGIVFGALLSVTVVPALVFTGVPPSGVLSDISSNEFYIMQHVIPAQVVVPLSLAIVLIALITICMLALGATARTVSQPSLSQTLRLNED